MSWEKKIFKKQLNIDPNSVLKTATRVSLTRAIVKRVRHTIAFLQVIGENTANNVESCRVGETNSTSNHALFYVPRREFRWNVCDERVRLRWSRTCLKYTVQIPFIEYTAKVKSEKGRKKGRMEKNRGEP